MKSNKTLLLANDIHNSHWLPADDVNKNRLTKKKSFECSEPDYCRTLAKYLFNITIYINVNFIVINFNKRTSKENWWCRQISSTIRTSEKKVITLKVSASIFCCRSTHNMWFCFASGKCYVERVNDGDVLSQIILSPLKCVKQFLWIPDNDWRAEHTERCLFRRWLEEFCSFRINFTLQPVVFK